MTLVERDEVLDQLGSLLMEARHGRGRVVLIRGEPGIGKTSVTRAFVDSVTDQAHVLWGACDDLLAARPMGPVWDIALDEPSLHEMLEQDERLKVFSEMYELLARSLRPTVLVIEDAHWADEATLDLIKYLGRRIHRTHGLLILTYREGDVGSDHPLPMVLGDLPHESVERITLHPLTPEGVARLAGNQQSTEYMWEVTGGNPFFVTELIDSGEELPSSIQDAMASRILRLSEPARELVELASVAPGRLELRLARQSLGDIEAVVSESERAGILELRGNALAFRHELARRAVERGLTEIRRRHLNLDVLEACEALGEDVSRCAHHARAAEDADAMVELLPEAARRAAALESHSEAVSHLRALEPYLDRFTELELADHLEFWAREELLTSNSRAKQVIERALEIRRRVGDPEPLGVALLTASRIAWVGAERPDAVRHAEEAASVLRPIGGEALGMALSTLSQLAMLANDDSQAIELGERALDQVGPGPSLVRAHALNNIGTSKTNTSYPDGVAELEESYRIAHALGLFYDEARAVVNLSWGHLFAREPESARPWLELGSQLMGQTENPATESYVRALWAIYEEMVGEWEESEKTASDIVKTKAEVETSRAAASMILAKVYVRRGQPDADSIARIAWEKAIKADEIQRLSPAGSVLAESLWLAGNVDAPLIADLKRVLDRCIEARAKWFGGELGFWLWRLGAINEVPNSMAEPFVQASQGDWRAASAFWENRPLPYELAMILSLGDSNARLRALDICDQLGAVPMASRLRSELKAEGVKRVPRGPQRATKESPLGLTPRQTDVIELLAEDLTNAEIADRLFLSTRTVDHHVSAILTRIGAKDRAEAVQIARGAGLIA